MGESYVEGEENQKPADTSISLTVRKTFTVAFGVDGAGGALAASAGGDFFASGQAFPAGTAVTFTATPEPGNIVEGWWVDGVQVPGEFTNCYSMTLTENTEVKVKFRKEETYTVTASVSEDSTGDGEFVLTCNGQPLENGGAVPYGASVTVAVEPDHSLVDYWKVNGKIYVGSDVHAITLDGISEDTEIVVGLSHESGTRPPSLKRADVELLGAPFVYSGRQIKPEIKVSDQETLFVEGVDYAVSYGENLNAGKDVGTITLTGMGDYAGSEKTVSFTIEKAPGAALSAPSASGAPLTNSITVNPFTPLTGQSVQYAIATEGNASAEALTWQDGTAFGGLAEYTPYYIYARAVENDNYKEGALSVSAAIRTADATPPTGEITVKTNGFTSFLHTISFGLFFKNTVDVEITAQDAHSGVASVEYALSGAALPENTDWDALEWTEYTGKFGLKSNWKGSVYARITDEAGNLTILNSDGVVVYSDAEQGTQSIRFTKTGTDDVTASVILNGNTVDQIKNGENALTPGTDYTVENHAITFHASYLDTLAASETPYTLTISYRPMGESYVEGEENQKPADTSLSLTVTKAEQTPPSIEQGLKIDKTYGDSAFTLSVTGGSGTGAITWQSSDESVASVDQTGKVTVHKPGKAVVTVTKAADGSFLQAQASTTVTVGKAALTVTAANAQKQYGEENPAFPYEMVGFVNGDTQEDLAALPVLTADADKTTGVGSYAIRLAGGADENYEYILNNVELTITPRPITVKADDKEMTEGGELPKLTWTVTEGSLVNSDDLGGSLKAEATGAGKHAITQDTPFANPNYTVTFLPGELTVLAKREDPSDPMPSEPTHPDAPQTGDDFPSWTLLLVLLSMGGIVLTFRSLGHRKEQ